MKKKKELPEKFDEGFLICDAFKTNWTIGKSIGQGGFGSIYSVKKDKSNADADDAQYVIKIEPKNNGTLFCENHFYTNAAKESYSKC